jgi:hypothetical protein
MDFSPFNRQWYEEGKSMSPSGYQIYIDVLDQYIRAGTSRLLNVSLNKTKT